MEKFLIVRKNPEAHPGTILYGICRKSELKLIGITFNENPCNWYTKFENMMEKANSRLYILRVSKYYAIHWRN